MGNSAKITKTISKPAPSRRASKSGDATAVSHSQLITLQWRKERPDLPLEDLLLSIYLLRLGDRLSRLFDQLCVDRWQVGGGDMRVILAIRRSGAPYCMRPTDLFRALVVTSGAMTKRVDRLEEAGLVERLQDPGHLGGFLVHLTKKGLRLADDATQSLTCNPILGPATSKLTKAEREAGYRFVLHMLASLEVEGDPD